MCANVRHAQALVDSDSDNVYMEPPTGCEKYKTSKKNVQRKYVLDALDDGDTLLGLSVEFFFYKAKANTEKQREFSHERVLLVFCQHTHGLAIARICGSWANCWQLVALLRDSAHVAGSHVQKSRKSAHD